MYVVTGIWLHMCKCMVECRWGNYFGSHFEVDGWCLRTQDWNLIRGMQRVWTRSSDDFSESQNTSPSQRLGFAWFGFRLVGVTIHPRFQAMTTARALEKAPKMPRLEKNSANESRAVFVGRVTALMMPAFWMVMILWERKGDRVRVQKKADI